MDDSSSCAKSSPQPEREYYDDMFPNITDLEFPSIFEGGGLDQPLIQYSEFESTVKRNSPLETSSSCERKRLNDRAYRQRRKEDIKRTKLEVDYLRNELSRLTKENETLKIEVVDKIKTLQSQEEMITQLQKNFHQVKTQNQSQSILVRVVSERLDSASDVDLRRENVKLKSQIDCLLKLIDNPNKVEVFKIEREKAESERQKKVFKVIVEALCEKIYNEEHHEQQQLR